LRACVIGLTAGLKGSHWQLPDSKTAIQPLLIGRNDEALAVMEGLRARGIWVPAIARPRCPKARRACASRCRPRTAKPISTLIEGLGALAKQAL
jgi:8-amino-7-oxononanoate synthase